MHDVAFCQESEHPSKAVTRSIAVISAMKSFLYLIAIQSYST